VDPGFQPESVLTFRISLPESAYPDEPRRAIFLDELRTRLGALPGVRLVGAVTGLPLSGMWFAIAFEVKGRPEVPPAQQPSMEVRVATPDYFKAIGIPLVRGRGLERGDTAQSGQVVLLSESAVRRYFPGEEPLGQWITLGMGRGPGLPRAGGEVVGIVGDVKQRALGEENLPTVYVPHAQFSAQSMDVLLRTAVSPLSLLPSVEQVVHGLDPELPVARPRPLKDIVARSVSRPRFYMLLLGAFAATALFLAALGIFGVMSYAVVQRSREIGIRLALGAEPADVMKMVLGQALPLVAIGVGAGLTGAVALSRALSSLLFNLSPTDPGTLGGVAVLLAAVALLASYLPARRATRVDPLVALRSE
jgi:putative ABC transport system permease protein